MEFADESLQFASEELGDTLGESGDIGDDEAETGKLAGLERLGESHGVLFGLVFVAGLLLGWLVIGWWFWPVQWSNSEPWFLHPERQRTYVGLVAEEYWHTGDISRARKALRGWDSEDLSNLLATMQSQASSPQERQHLLELAQSLALPDPEESLFASLHDQKFLILSVFLSALPLVIAVVMVVFPMIRNRTKASDELLPGQSIEELEGNLETQLDQKEQTEEEGEVERGEGGVKEKDDEEGLGLGDEEDDWLDEEIGEEGAVLGDILTDLFDEDSETLAHYAALCKDLDDIDINVLVQNGFKTLGQIVRNNELHQQ